MLLRPQCRKLSGWVLRQACEGRSQRLGKRKRVAVQASAAPEDPWQTLGVSRDADAKTVKKAYRKLALRSHPDLNKDPGAAATFLRIQGAYETLSGRRRGKSIEQPSKRGDWDFHDWYWQFSASRKWEKSHQHKERAATAHSAAASPAQTRAQLDGLRRKAAFRKHKAQHEPTAARPGTARRSRDVHVHAERDDAPPLKQQSPDHQEPLRRQLQPRTTSQLQHEAPASSGRQSGQAPPLFNGQMPTSATASSHGPLHGQPVGTAVFSVDFRQWGSLHACLAMLSLHLLHTSAAHHGSSSSSTVLKAEHGSSGGSSLVSAASHHDGDGSAREARRHDSEAALAGMGSLQSQLAGLRRRSAMRPV